jgi:amino acid adenylation domain-containing protein
MSNGEEGSSRMKSSLGGYRLSPQQRRIWTGQEGGAPWAARLVVEIVGPLDETRLERALRSVVDRHEILRSCFVTPRGLRWPLQVVGGDQRPVLRPSAEPLPAVDLGRLPLLDASLARAGADSHWLTLAIPSLCADARSLGLVFEELVDQYGLVSRPRPRLQYAHYADWRLEAGATGEAPAEEIRSPELPAERPASGGRFDDRASVPLLLDGVAVDRLAAALASPVEIVVLAAWLALLHRLSARSPVSCQVIVDGRVHQELAAVAGPIDQVRPITGAIAAGMPFADLVAAVGRDHLELRDRIGEGAEPAGRQRSAEIGFDQVTLASPLRVGDTLFRVREQSARLECFKLRLCCVQEGQELRGQLCFDPDVFAAGSVAGFSDSLAALVRHASADPRSPVAGLRLLEGAQRAAVLSLGDGRAPAPSRAETAHRLFEAQVARSPSAIAAEEGPLRIGYADLDRRAEVIARRLCALGVTPEEPVVVFMDASLPLLAGLLGVWKAGGVYVPLDPGDPPQRLARILALARPRAVITRAALAAHLPGEVNVGPLIILEQDGALADPRHRAAGGSDPPPAGEVLALPRIQGDNLAYVIFTSGSSGEPKGVCISHRALVSYLGWCRQAYAMDPALGAWVHSSPSFDLGLTALLAPLATGQRARFVPAAAPEALAEALRGEQGRGLLKLTPSHLRAFRQALAGASGPLTLVVGGESLHHEDLAPLCRAGIRVFNEYGPTEATVGCCVHPVEGECGSGPVPIGRPIPGTRCHVLDDQLEPLPPGVKGALYIGGAGLARGYLRAPALTAERFVPDPFAAEPGQRLYRTGDLARVGADGQLEFCGRDDDQVKVRGHRIELGEVEAALRRRPEVGDAAVLLRGGDGPGADTLVAFVAPRAASPRASLPPGDELRALLRQWLPDAVIPASITPLDQLPRAASGKLDRLALEEAAARDQGPLVAPRDDVEQILAGVFSEVLGRPGAAVGIDDNYFALGGDSIRSIQVVARARARNVELGVDQIFAHPTIRRLAAHVRSSHPEAALPPTAPFALLGPEDRQRVAAEDADVVDAYPLAALQAGMIFHQDLAGSGVYHDIFSFHLEAPFEEGPFRAAATALVARHPACRTSFDLARFSRPLQLVHRHGPDPLTVSDLRGVSRQDQDRIIGEHLAAEGARGLDITALPLIRFHVHQRSEQSFQFNLSFHHAVIDGWSDATMLTELFHDYLCRLEGRPAALEPPRARIADFIALEERAIASAETARFWQRTLAGSTPLRLPGSPRSGAARRMVRRTRDLPAEICRGVRALALATAVPLKSVMLAAHLAVMKMLQGDPDVTTCMVSSGRIEGLDGDRVLGLFINSIPVRARLEPGAWRNLVQQTRLVEQELLPHRRVPMAEIQRRQGGEPLSEVLFYFTDYHVYRSQQTLGRVKVLDYIPHEETSFPLTVSFGVDPLGSRIQLDLMGDEARLGRQTMDLVESALLQALAAMSEDPERRHDTQSLLPPEMERRLLVEWNATTRDLGAAEARLHHLFAAQAERTPDAPAVVADGVAWSYSALRGRVRSLADHLISLGVGPESVVGVHLGRSAELVVAVLGVLEAGAAYLPLDPEHPRERLDFIVEEAAAPVVISHRPWIDTAPRRAGTALVDLAAVPESGAPPRPPGRTDADGAAYVIYTSGSTGRPKGVINTHRGVCNRILWMQDAYRLTPADRVLQRTPFGFDVSVWEFFWPLATGATLVVAPPDAHRDPSLLARSITTHGVTVMHFVPSLLEVFLEQLDGAWSSSLRLVVCSGEELGKPLCDRFFARVPGAALANLYGPTEAAIDVTAFGCQAGDPGPIPIGKPIANMRTYLLDAEMAPVPVGVIGHLHLGGVGLARGYLRRPALTAAAFVPDPFATGAGRLYRTGDLARYLPDGNLEFCGRADQQVKVRGVRVELGEIESALAERPGVRAAVVRALGERGAPLVLAAYVVSDDPALTAEELRRHLRRSLADAVIPSFIIFLAALPVTANGKVDRRALPDPRLAPGRTDGEPRPPRTPLEALVAGVWQEALGVAPVGLDDNFFLLGGHSLLLVRVVGRLRALLRLPLPIRMFHERPTLRELVEGIEAFGQTGAVYQAPAWKAVAPGAATPLSFAQEGIWLAERSAAVGSAYHIPMAVRMNGDVDRTALTRALARLVDRHEMLRTVFEEVGGAPVQRSRQDVAIPLEVAEGPAADDDPGATRWMQAVAARPFDLGSGPLLRVALRRERDGDHLLLLVVHHLVADGWSLGVLIRDLVELYDSGRCQRAASLPALPLQYAGYASWQREQETSQAWAGHRQYWRSRLAHLPPPHDFPESAPRPVLRSYRGSRLPLSLPEDLSAAVRALARDTDSTLYTVLLTAFHLLLCHHGAGTDIVIGTDVSGREAPGTEDLVGCLVNQLVLRTRLTGGEDLTFRAALAQVKETVLQALEHQDLPFEVLLRELRPRREPGRPPLFQIKMVFQQTPTERIQLPGVSFEPISVDSGASKWDLLLDLWDSRAGIRGALTHDRELFAPSFAQLLARGLEIILAAASADPEVRRGTLDAALARGTDRHRADQASAVAAANQRLLRGARDRKSLARSKSNEG